MARLNSVAGQYISAEAANVQQTLVNAVNAPAELLLGHPLYGTGQGGAAASAAANYYVNSFNRSESFNTPFGALTLSSKTTGTFYVDGPVTTTLSAHVPGASLLWSYGGEFSGGGTTLQFTRDTFVVPPAVPLLAALAGPYVTGAASLLNSGTTFTDLADSGHPFAAVADLVIAPFNFTDAVLFGHQTVTVPFLPVGGWGGASLEMHIPFGGIFASPEPLSTTWPQYDYYDPNTETTTTVLGSEFSYRGTQFGGILWELLSTFVFGL